MLKEHQIFLDKILNATRTVQSEFVGTNKALGRVLAENVRSKCNSPSQDVSAVDGYAVITEDLSKVPCVLKSMGESTARKGYKSDIKDGQTVKVYAGAPIPVGADSVVPLSHVEEGDDGEITFTCEDHLHGQNICYKGFDYEENEEAIKEGKIINSRDIGLAASMRVAWLPVRRKPRIGVLSIGDELIMFGEHSTGENNTISSSSLMIAQFINACGAEAVNLGVCPDSKAGIDKVLEYQSNLDLIVTTGGIAASSDGILREVIIAMETKVDELMVSLHKEEDVLYKEAAVPILSLPGSPMSSQICSVLFLKPVIQKMLALKDYLYKKKYAILARNLDKNDLEMDYIFATLSESENKRLEVFPASSQDRLMLSQLALADCVISVDQENCKKGDPVEIRYFTCSVISG